jgi:hypothetical protein
MEYLYLGYPGAWLYNHAPALWIVAVGFALTFVAKEIRRA